jgi:hypothetical protein
LRFPVFWSEVYVEGKWIPIDAITLNLIASEPDQIAKFEPRGKAAEEKKIVMGYVVAYDSGNFCHQARKLTRTLYEGCHSTVCQEFPWKSKEMEDP